MRAAAQAIYERYLKSQGIKDEIRSQDLFFFFFAWKRGGVRWPTPMCYNLAS